MSTSAFGQQIKIGYTNTEYILANMTEFRVAQAQLYRYQGQLKDSIETIEKKISDKYKEYQQLNNNSGAQKEINDLQEEIQLLETKYTQQTQSVDLKISNRQNELFQPLYAKIQNAINVVAEEHKFNFIMNSSSLIYASDGTDISNLVFKKLGIDPPKG